MIYLTQETKADDSSSVDKHRKQGFYFYWNREKILNFGDEGLDLPPEKLDGLDDDATVHGYA